MLTADELDDALEKEKCEVKLQTQACKSIGMGYHVKWFMVKVLLKIMVLYQLKLTVVLKIGFDELRQKSLVHVIVINRASETLTNQLDICIGSDDRFLNLMVYSDS